jgi:hypothetical protein
LVPLFRATISPDYARPAVLLGPFVYFVAAFIGAYVIVISAPSTPRYQANVVVIPALLIATALWREAPGWSAFVPPFVAALAVPVGAATAQASMSVRLEVHRLHFRQWPAHWLLAVCVLWSAACFMLLPSLYGAQYLMADLRTGGMRDRFIVRLPDDRTVLWLILLLPQFVLLVVWLVARYRSEHIRNDHGAV